MFQFQVVVVVVVYVDVDVVVFTCEERGTPYWLLGVGRRVWPEWKVDLRGKKTLLRAAD